MKKLIPAIAIVLGCASAAWPAPPAPITTLRAFHALGNDEASQHPPVAFEGTVTYFDKHWVLFVQDDGVGVYIGPNANTPTTLVPGDRVLVRGKAAPSFRPNVMDSSVTLLRHGELPKPVPAAYDELNHNLLDAVLVTVRGVVRSADKTESYPGTRFASIVVLADGGYIWVTAEGFTAKELEDMLDAEVEMTGVEGGQFDGKNQMHGVHLHVTSPAYVKVLKHAAANPWSLPITSMDGVIAGYHVNDRTRRVRVHGTITYYQPGQSVVLQDGPKSLWISTLTLEPLRVGDVVDATGFPVAHHGFLALERAEIRDSHVQAPIAPLPTTRKELTTSIHIIDLVSVEAQVMSSAQGATQDEYNLLADGQLFTAVYRHATAFAGPPPPMKQIPPGAKVRVTGICITEDQNAFTYDSQAPFDILMRSFDDIEIVAEPSLVNTRNLILVVSVLLVVVVAVGGWGWTLRRKVRSQTADLAKRIEAEAVLERRSAQLERQRSRVLEDINGARPLAEIVDEIVEMVSFGLKGAPCWCEIADGAAAGVRPPETDGLRILREKIAARSGPPLGEIFAGLDPLAPPDDAEREALSVGVRLIALAIETRRLYSDLRRRSEFDQLTEIHNRFSMDKHLDDLIEDAGRNAGVFGLIYIDLDKFKPINDRYGHHVGDLYLQAVAVRMKNQLRAGDMLARLGGDEFAALVSSVRCRADVEEVVHRLECCFNTPFGVEGCLLRGEASFGFALYPEDSATKDSLLNAADAAMYAAKNSKKQAAQAMASLREPDLAPVRSA